ncbi:hypothetical protein Q0M94_25070 (plasmid) [Deinococcus radiomollis]|uniref:hypothetical protein n=1 Tax=Deinococcus radiomollis TaxID=468916 RepID=UPI0038927B18
MTAILNDLAPGQFRVPLYHTDKLDFGDMDLLVDADLMTQPFLDEFGRRAGALERRALGNAQSFHVPTPHGGLQVDLFPTSAALLDTRQSFMDWGDLGNILGRLVRPYGLMWSEEGAWFVYRRENDDHYVHRIHVPGGTELLLDVIGLDDTALRQGFQNEAQMFRWIITARDFRTPPFLDQDGAVQRRAKSRPGMARFQAFLHTEIQAGRLAETSKMERQPLERLLTVLGSAAARKLETAVNEQRQLEDRARRLRLRFSGTLLHDLRPELDTLELQTLVRGLSTDTERQAWMLTQTPEDVHAWLKHLPVPEISAESRESYDRKQKAHAEREARKAKRKAGA